MNSVAKIPAASQPSTELVQAVQYGRSLTAADIRQRVNVIQEVMRAVMKPDVHYGVIPGCKKPSLYKPGSEVLLATFQIAPSIVVEDLSTEDSIRYRVRVIGTHGPSGMVIGEGIGECSSNEEKYKWRKAWDDEFAATPENRRRVKFGKFKDKQVRTEPADVANTILKMAKKRAQIDMTLTATGASDCFEQDIEDLPEELRPSHGASEAPAAPAPLPTYSQAEFDAKLPAWRDLIESGKRSADQVLAMVGSKVALTDVQQTAIRKLEPKPAPEPDHPEAEGAEVPA